MPPVKARAPLDVDLEDKLIFGLTPVRFGYLAVGALAAYVLGAHSPLAAVLRLPAAVILLLAAAGVAWVRWRGRPLDAWLLDLAIYARRNLEVELDPLLLRRIRAPLRSRSWTRRPRPPRRQPRVPTITVVAERPGAGATTVAVELGTALALKGRRVAISQAAGAEDAAPRLGLTGWGRHQPSGLALVAEGASEDAECVVIDLGARARHRDADLALVVASDPTADVQRHVRRTGRAAHVAIVINRDRTKEQDPVGVLTGPHEVAAVIPDDPAVPDAQANRDPVIVCFPSSRAAQAFRRLADAVDPNPPAPWQRTDSDRPRAG